MCIYMCIYKLCTRFLANEMVIKLGLCLAHHSISVVNICWLRLWVGWSDSLERPKKDVTQSPVQKNQLAIRQIGFLHLFFWLRVWGCMTVDFPGEFAQTQCIFVVHLLGGHMCMVSKFSRHYVTGKLHAPRTPLEEWQQVAVGCWGSLGPSIKATIPIV